MIHALTSTYLAGYPLDAEIDLNYNVIVLNVEHLASIDCTGNEQSINDCSITTSDLSSDFRNFIGIPAGVQCIGKSNMLCM